MLRTAVIAASIVAVPLVLWLVIGGARGGRQIIDNPGQLKRELDRLAARLRPLEGKVGASQQTGPGDYERFLTIEGRKRRYELHVPPGYKADTPMPLVLSFHGGGGRAGLSRIQTQLDSKADDADFIVAYPDGSGRFARRLLTWNAGRCCGYAKEQNVDDVAFVNAILDDVQAFFAIDSYRVYATGHSNGAMMCYRIACELSERIAAIAPVGATMGVDACEPARPVSIMHFHGTADPNSPYNGGVGKHSLSKVEFMSVDRCIEDWRRRDGCDSPPVETRKQDEATIVTCRAESGVEVVLVGIEGMGHTWPGGRRLAKESFSGALNQKISANDMMWEFFTRHSLKADGEVATTRRSSP
ncbi:MAG: PHB depolymerase family esterase [Planctomycetota bacterium]